MVHAHIDAYPLQFASDWHQKDVAESFLEMFASFGNDFKRQLKAALEMYKACQIFAWQE